LMHAYVFVQIGFLGECLVAAIRSTYKRAFSRV